MRSIVRAHRGSVVLVALIGIAGAALAQTTGALPAQQPPRVEPAPDQAAPAQAAPAGAAPAAAAVAAPAAPAASVCDAACVRGAADLASQICAPRIEAEAPTDFEWVSRPFAKIFQQADPPEGTATVIRYRGDSIRFLSPQREWVRVTYECGFDAAKRSVDYVRVRLGRLDKPSSAPQAAQARSQPTPAPVNQQQAGPATPPVPKRIRPSEPSEIEIGQVNPRARQGRP